EVAQGRWVGGPPAPARRSENAVATGRRPHLLAGGAGYRRELPARRQQLHRQTGRLRAIHRGRPPARVLLGADEPTDARAPVRLSWETAPMMPLNVLLLEDRATDAELVLHELRRAGFGPVGTRVDTETDYLAALCPDLDVILADYSLPQFDATRALA